MVVDVFSYMFFVGAGIATGVAVVAFISWKVVQRSLNKNTRKRGIANGFARKK